MLTILYEDREILVVEKPAGIESQSSRSLEPDMVSEIKKYRSRCTKDQLSTNISTNPSTEAVDTYVGVIHRLDKPVGGVMVYAKTKRAAASLSKQVQDGRMKKVYWAVVCGKPVDNVGNYVDYLLRDGKTNFSKVVDKGTPEAKRAELRYRVIETAKAGTSAGQPGQPGQPKQPEQNGEVDERILTLVEIELLTGRSHQIRVQFAAHGTPLWGDARYNPLFGGTLPVAGERGTLPARSDASAGSGASAGSEPRGGEPALPRRPICRRGSSLALAAVRLSFIHPESGKTVEFSTKPKGAIFKNFNGPLQC